MMSHYRLRLLNQGRSSTIELPSTTVDDARAHARRILAEAGEARGAELWRFDEEIRSLTLIGFIPYALRAKSAAMKSGTSNGLQLKLVDA
jgi:hypothetical protein